MHHLYQWNTFDQGKDMHHLTTKDYISGIRLVKGRICIT